MNNSIAKRRLIVNADDFGRSPGVNRGVIQAHVSGIVTSASLMVRWPAAIEAAVYGSEHPDLSIGLHLDMEEMSWVDGAWVQRYQVVPATDVRAIERETLLQLEAFRRLIGRNPSHLDSHQCVHQNEPVRVVLSEIADWLGIPLRGCSRQVRHCADFYGQDSKGRPSPRSISVENLCQTIAGLKPGITELSCHPGVAGDWDSMYKSERTREVETLCHPKVRAELEETGVELCSFHDIDLILRQDSSVEQMRFSRKLRTA